MIATLILDNNNIIIYGTVLWAISGSLRQQQSAMSENLTLRHHTVDNWRGLPHRILLVDQTDALHPLRQPLRPADLLLHAKNEDPDAAGVLYQLRVQSQSCAKELVFAKHCAKALKRRPLSGRCFWAVLYYYNYNYYYYYHY